MKDSIDRILGIGLVLLTFVAIVACRPAAPASEPAPTPDDTVKTQGGNAQSLLTAHDDPIVIDNAPARIDLGHRARPSPPNNNEKRWIRQAHKLDYMAILRRRVSDGMILFRDVVALCPRNCIVTLGLDGGNGVTTTFSFEFNADDEELAVTDANDRKFKNANGRWLKPRDMGDTKDEDLWIRTIEVKDPDKKDPIFSQDFRTAGPDYEVDIVIVTAE